MALMSNCEECGRKLRWQRIPGDKKARWHHLDERHMPVRSEDHKPVPAHA